jgi:predicted aspartyl protease
MSSAFNAKHGPILVEAEVTGPGRSMTLSLILDTGATTSLLKETVLVALGYDLATATVRVPVTTGTVVTTVPSVMLTRLTALGHHRFGFPVLAHPLHAGLSVSGLLGLDFLRDQSLTVDFRRGEITLV